jgi:short-subunit dehydrogenase
MTFIYVPWDFLIKPAAHDEEVWFGLMFRGGWAKVAEIPHWLVYGALLYGLRRMRPWTGLLGALYSAQIALGMFVWNWMHLGGLFGFFIGAVGAVPFSALALVFWSAAEFSAPRPNLKDRYGDWALVTGASAGIGAEFARALARDGVSVALVARREYRLADLASELEKNPGVQTRVVAVDLSEPEAADAVVESVSDLEIAILVNNAGFGYSGRFDGQDAARIRELVTVNCTTPSLLTSALLPAMRQRRRGAVLFTGSVAGRQPLPLHAAYAASKAFDNYLAEALYIEMRDSGVDVLVVEPGSTATEFQQVAGEIPHHGESAVHVVDVALSALGRQPSVVSGWKNYLIATLPQRLLSRPLMLYLSRGAMRVQTRAERQ